MRKIPSHLKKTSWSVCPKCGSKQTDHDEASDLDGTAWCQKCGWQWTMYDEKD